MSDQEPELEPLARDAVVEPRGASEREAAIRLAGLAAAGSPLPSGLAALADDIGNPRVAARLRAAAARLKAGAPFGQALAELHMPAIEQLITQAVLQGRVPQVLDDCLHADRERTRERREFFRAFVIPIALIALLGIWLYMMIILIVPAFAGLWTDWGLLPRAELLTRLFMWLGSLGPLRLLAIFAAPPAVLIGARLALGSQRFRELWRWAPVVGPIIRYRELIAWVTSLRSLVALRTPLDTALESAATGRYGSLAQASREMAAGMRQGASLSACAAAEHALPRSFAAMLAWGEAANSLDAALDVAARHWRDRLESSFRLARHIMPLATIMLMAFVVGTTVGALLAPLLSMITWLSAYDYNERRASDISIARAVVFFGMLSVPVVASYFWEAHLIGQSALMSFVRLSIARSLPVAPMLRAFAREQGGSRRAQVLDVVEMLEEGHPLASGLMVYPQLVPRPLRRILAAPLSDEQAIVLSLDMESSRSQMGAARRRLAATGMIVSGFLFVYSFLGFFITIKLFPSYGHLARDFDADPEYFRSLAQNAPLVLEFLGLLILYASASLCYWFAMSFGQLRIPGESFIFPRSDTALALRSLAVAARGQVTFPSALEPLANSLRSSKTARRLRGAIGDMRSGVGWSQSLRGANLITSKEQLQLDVAERHGILAAELDALATTLEWRAIIRCDKINNLAGLMAMLIFGLATLMLALPTMHFLNSAVEAIH